MAKATAHCTCRRCGKEYEITVTGHNRHDADSKAEYLSGEGICSECRKIEEQEKLAALKIDLGKPNPENPINLIKVVDLKGSEKQIRWAEDLRKWLTKGLQIQGDGNCEFAKQVQADIDASRAAGQPEEELERGLNMVADAIKFTAQIDSAKWWIEKGRKYNYHGYKNAYSIATEHPDFAEWLGETDMTKEEIQEQHDESLMIPEDATSSTEAMVTISDNKIRISSDKDMDLIAAVKEMGCRWDSPYWVKSVPTAVATMPDAAAEVINGLLNKGFPVICKDAEIREMALTGNYTPVPTRHITYCKDTDTLDIKWQGKNDKIYQAARAIKGSKWHSPVVEVKAKHYQQIEGFAELYGFVISPGAQAEMDKAKAKAIASTVKVAKHKDNNPEELDLEAILERPAEVMDKHKLED